jgi:isoamylase
VKHNGANGEGNRDGTDDNRSWNCGVEGETDDASVTALRHRQAQNLAATLLLATGVPMITAGDELGRTQLGNNNAYCQDNPTSWFDWEDADKELLEFTTALVALRQAHPALRRRRYVTGATPGEVGWFTPNGTPMTDADWRNPVARGLAILVDGSAEPDRDPEGDFLIDDDLLVLVNGWWETLPFTLPAPPRPPEAQPVSWRIELDTFTGTVWPVETEVQSPGSVVDVGPRSMVLLVAPQRRVGG